MGRAVNFPARIDRKSHRENAGKRSPAHRAFVRSHGCCVPGCDRRPVEFAHVRGGTGGGIGVKPSDRWGISLCGHDIEFEGHHAEQHRIGEASFAAKYAIDLTALALEFVKRSPRRALLEQMN